MPQIFENRNVFSLLEVNNSIKRTIEDRYGSDFWVMAEMNKLNYYSHSGHCFPELVQKDKGKVIALSSSLIWKNDYERINKKFLRVLEEPLRNGIKILFLAAIQYDPVHGISLWIKDIDPSFSLGELEKEKQETIQKLKKENLFDRNKSLPIAVIPQRIAIISVESSKGYSDFLKVIEQNENGFQVFHMLFPALLQGERSVPSILRQLKLIEKVIHHFDLVAIIRGGGGDVGLSSYNNYALAAAIAQYPIPVITGIGHSTNETVSEMVAFKNAITPTELGDWILQKFRAYNDGVKHAATYISGYSQQLIEQEKMRFDNNIRYFQSVTKNIILRNNHAIETLIQSCKMNTQVLFQNEKNALQLLAKSVHLLDPKNVLQRGFTLTLQNEKIILRAKDIQQNQLITTLFSDGEIISEIK